MRYATFFRTTVLLTALCLKVQAGAGSTKVHPLEPGDFSSPRATLMTFMDACTDAYDDIVSRGGAKDTKQRGTDHITRRILRCLDLREEAEYLRLDAGRTAGVCLKEILDRIELLPWDEIPDAAAVKEAAEKGGLPYWRIPHTPLRIGRIADGPRMGEYVFTAATVSRAAELYERVAALPYRTTGPRVTKGLYRWLLSKPGTQWLAAFVDRLPAGVKRRVGGQAIWQWIGLAVTVAAALFIMITAYGLGRAREKVTRRLNLVRYCLTVIFPVAAMLVPLLAKGFITGPLAISGKTRAVAMFTANLVFLFAAMVVVAGICNRIAAIVTTRSRFKPKGLDAQFVRLVFRVLGIVAATAIFLEGGRYMGIPLTTLVAGAGVGGLALALSAQDMLKNIFGSMMIILDRPYKIGERIIAKGYDGIVEEIGLRSTKIRLLTGHLASIPNEDMARSDVENVGRRPHIRRIADIPLSLDIPPDRAACAVQIIRDLLESHEGIDPAFPPRAYLNDFNRDSLNLRFIYWYHPPNYWDFLAYSEKLNLEIKRRFAAEGITIALPATATHISPEGDGPLELKVVNETERQETLDS